MPPSPRREFRTFLSHAHLDKTVVDRLYSWLRDVAGIPTWYDAVNLSSGTQIATHLAEAVAHCRSMIIGISESSVRSGWVKEELEAAVGQRAQFPDYRIIPLRLDDVPMPPALQTTKWIDLRAGRLSLQTANELLSGMFGDDGFDPQTARDVYLSASWRPGEDQLPGRVSRILAASGFRLVGDSKDQKGFGEGQRVRSIIASCGALVAVLPDRGNGTTSDYILKEIAAAREIGVPHAVVAEPGVAVPPGVDDRVLVRVAAGADATGDGAFRTAVQRIEDEWAAPRAPHQAFLATAFKGDNSRERNRILRQVIQRTTAMHCLVGDNVLESNVQQYIVNAIRGAFFVLADIAEPTEPGRYEDNLNTCIEAGVALGANRPLHLVAAGPRRRPPFMFRHIEVQHYQDDAELVGKIHMLIYQYRRRVINRELDSSR